MLDCRGTDTTSPSAFLEKLIDALVKDVPLEKLTEMLERVRSSFGTAVEVKQWFFKPGPQDLNKLFKAFVVGPDNTPKTLSDAYKAIE